MKSLYPGIVIALSFSFAIAHADGLPAEHPPSMVGVWKPIGITAAVRVGEAVSGYPKSGKPVFNLKPRPYVVVNDQEGREIAGYEVFADGTHEPMVGVFKLSGKLIVSTSRGSATIDFYGDDMEWCWQDNLADVAIVSCDVLRKEPAKP
jgi:hypothetical protein